MKSTLSIIKPGINEYLFTRSDVVPEMKDGIYSTRVICYLNGIFLFVKNSTGQLVIPGGKSEHLGINESSIIKALENSGIGKEYLPQFMNDYIYSIKCDVGRNAIRELVEETPVVTHSLEPFGYQKDFEYLDEVSFIAKDFLIFDVNGLPKKITHFNEIINDNFSPIGEKSFDIELVPISKLVSLLFNDSNSKNGFSTIVYTQQSILLEFIFELAKTDTKIKKLIF